MNAGIDFDAIGNFLKGYDNNLFALVFGSAAEEENIYELELLTKET